MINSLFYINHYILVSHILKSFELGYIMGLEIKKKNVHVLLNCYFHS